MRELYCERGNVTCALPLAACRLKAYGKKTIEDVYEALKGLPDGLATAFNLGHADVFPATSGKENAAKYLMSKFDADPSSSFLLCDDDNDVGEPCVQI